MPVLFVCSRESDYLQDLTYAGLSEVLGKDSVIDFPTHWSYHKEKKWLWSRAAEYPRNLGYSPGPRHQEWGANRVRAALRKNDFELVLLAAAKPDALDAFANLFDHMRLPWVFIDGGDRTEVGGDFERNGGPAYSARFADLCRRNPPALVFKRELPLGRQPESVVPFPFSAHAARIPVLSPEGEKKSRVLFWAVESSEARRQAFRILKGRYDCEANGSVAGQTFRKYALRGRAYFEALNQARICLSFRGEGFDTLRYWEVPACGSLLLSERPTIQIPDDFEDKKHAVFCKNDLSDLVPLIDYYLSHEREAREISAAGQRHLLKHHTHLRRAEALIERVRSGLKIRLG